MAECDCAPAKDVVIEETAERVRFITVLEAGRCSTTPGFRSNGSPI